MTRKRRIWNSVETIGWKMVEGTGRVLEATQQRLGFIAEFAFDPSSLRSETGLGDAVADIGRGGASPAGRRWRRGE